MQHYNEIDLTKGFAIILAVFGHAAPDAVKGFWIVGTDSLSASLHYLVYSFHMALFFACSGFLLYPKLNNVGGALFGIPRRFRKLMVPYIFLSLVYLFAKMFGGGLADNQLTGNPIVAILFGSSPCFGAWFLWCLFFMTVVVLLFKKVNIWILFVVSVLLSYVPIEYGENFMGLEKAQANIMWVLLGCIVRKYYNCISPKVNIYLGLFSACVLIFLHLSNGLINVENSIIAHTISILKTLSGIIASFTFCYLLAYHTASLSYRCLKLCGDYCMDIYILSMFVLVPLRILYVNVGLMNYVPYYVWLVIASVLGVIIPIIVSKYFVRKVMLLNVLLLGG